MAGKSNEGSPGVLKQEKDQLMEEQAQYAALDTQPPSRVITFEADVSTEGGICNYRCHVEARNLKSEADFEELIQALHCAKSTFRESQKQLAHTH